MFATHRKESPITYPDARYLGGKGEIGAVFRPADREPG